MSFNTVPQVCFGEAHERWLRFPIAEVGRRRGQGTMNQELPKGGTGFRQKLLLGLGLSVGGLLTAYMVLVLTFVIYAWSGELMPMLRFLPSDEEMVAHFQRHRADFERLVQLYREDPRRGVMIKPTREMKTIMKRIKVNGIAPDQRIWLPPDPYSGQARREIETLRLRRKADRGDPEARKFGGVILDYTPEPVIRLKNLSYVAKEYYYTPLVPKVEGGLLKTPDVNWRIFPTLNRYPPDLWAMQCAYRQFEPQWFIRMCEHD